MAVRLDQVEKMLAANLGGAFLSRCPALPYEVNAILVRFGRTQDPLAQLYAELDSLLFNTIYLATEKSMTVTLDTGRTARITSDGIRDLADRLLALSYRGKDANSLLQDTLFDFAREGSYAAMRELLARFPLDQFDRAWLTQVLAENNQLT